MKTTLDSIQTAGHGHKEVTITYTDGKEYSAVTSNMPLIDDYKSDIFTITDARKVASAKRKLIRFVKDRNNLK